MRKGIKYVVLAVSALVWAIGMSPYEWFFPALYRNGILLDEYRFGDLYHLSNLPQFKAPLLKCPSEPPPALSASAPVHLYLLGDSFTEKQRIDSSDFPVAAYHFVKWDQFLPVRLDTSAVNIVLIETVERHFRQHFEVPPHGTFVTDTATSVEKLARAPLMTRIDAFFESGRAEGQLELLLFNNSFGLWLKELKAWCTYRWFNRAAEKVTVSDDGAHLVYYLDTDTVRFAHTSGFSKISESRIDSLVRSINTTSVALKKIGFDEVILSVIPNKSTIVMPEYGRYNHLIERVQGHPELAVPYVDILEDYRKLGEKAYLEQDSHWTCEGRLLWIRKVNELLFGLTGPAPVPAGTTALSSDCLTPGSTRSLISAGRLR